MLRGPRIPGLQFGWRCWRVFGRWTLWGATVWYGGFHKWGYPWVPQNIFVIMENPIQNIQMESSICFSLHFLTFEFAHSDVQMAGFLKRQTCGSRAGHMGPCQLRRSANDLTARTRPSGFVDQWQTSAEDETGGFMCNVNRGWINYGLLIRGVLPK